MQTNATEPTLKKAFHFSQILFCVFVKVVVLKFPSWLSEAPLASSVTSWYIRAIELLCNSLYSAVHGKQLWKIIEKYKN